MENYGLGYSELVEMKFCSVIVFEEENSCGSILVEGGFGIF